MKLHHIGIACKNIAQTSEAIQRLHKVVSKLDIVYDEYQEAKVCLLMIEGGTNIELIEGKPVESILKKGMGYYHLCYEVNDLESAINRLSQNGAVLVSPPKPAKLFNMRKVAFLQTVYGLIELVES